MTTNNSHNISIKFVHPDYTVTGDARASVAFTQWQTLWFNTGTLCNLACINCYIESTPKNDKLVYLSLAEVECYLDEIKSETLSVQEIGFTGGEPFMNPAMTDILQNALSRGFRVLMLTNAMGPMMKQAQPLLALGQQFGSLLQIRVSLDHYTEEKHALERGARAWKPVIKGLQWLAKHNFFVSIAGRTLWGELEDKARAGYQHLFSQLDLGVNAFDAKFLTLFPEMDKSLDTPEISTKCWDILKVKPQDIMCANSRMVVKAKGEPFPKVVACTLIPHDKAFAMGRTLKEAVGTVKLNHPFCSKFCVLGGASCNQ